MTSSAGSFWVRRPSPGWPVCATHAAPRRTADAATNMSVTTLVGFAMHGVRHVSRRPVAVFVLATSFQQHRCGSFPAGDPLAGSVFCRTYDIHLEQCARVLFNFKKTKGHGSSPRFPRCPRKTQTRHWPQGDAASCAFFPMWHDGPRQGQGTSLLLQSVRIPLRLCCQTEQPNKCEGILFQAHLSNQRRLGSSKMFSSSLCSSTIASTE